MTEPFLTRLDSPIGRIELIADSEALTSLSIEHDSELPHDGVDEHVNAVLTRARTQLDEYFSATRTRFDVPVRFTDGTAFQRAVWAELERLGWGESTSYGALAAALGRPAASRAIGGAVGANPMPIIVGCHRVLASDRRITGYSGGNGVPTKEWLLAHERIEFAS